MRLRDLPEFYQNREMVVKEFRRDLNFVYRDFFNDHDGKLFKTYTEYVQRDIEILIIHNAEDRAQIIRRRQKIHQFSDQKYVCYLV